MALVTVKVVRKIMHKGRYKKLYTTSFTNAVLPFSVNYTSVILFPLQSSRNNVILFLCVWTGYQNFVGKLRL